MQATDLDKTKHISDKGFASRICLKKKKTQRKLNNKTTVKFFMILCNFIAPWSSMFFCVFYIF